MKNVWTGCNECDVSFDCWDGGARCIRLPKEKELKTASTLIEHCEALQERIPALETEKRQLQAEIQGLSEQLADLKEDLGSCELCQRDLVTPNPDGSHHNCVCLACYNAAFKKP